jgi:protein-S-isoprenylcysteine O-methyltransferase Ste14
MTILHVLAGVCFTACFASFSWAMSGGFFRYVAAPSLGLWIIRIASAASVLVHTVILVCLKNFTVVRATSAICLYMFALFLFWLTIATNRQKPLSLAFSPDLPHFLVTRGPYRFIRHPFYTSYFLAWSAGAILTQNIVVVFTCIAMGTIHVVAALHDEKKFARSLLSERYNHYRRQTGMFVPRLSFLKVLVQDTKARYTKS